MNDTPGGIGGGNPSELKYLAISRINDARILLAVSSATTKRAYAEEVSDHRFQSRGASTCFFLSLTPITPLLYLLTVLLL